MKNTVDRIRTYVGTTIIEVYLKCINESATYDTAHWNSTESILFQEPVLNIINLQKLLY